MSIWHWYILKKQYCYCSWNDDYRTLPATLSYCTPNIVYHLSSSSSDSEVKGHIHAAKISRTMAEGPVIFLQRITVSSEIIDGRCDAPSLKFQYFMKKQHHYWAETKPLPSDFDDMVIAVVFSLGCICNINLTRWSFGNNLNLRVYEYATSFPQHCHLGSTQ